MFHSRWVFSWFAVALVVGCTLPTIDTQKTMAGTGSYTGSVLVVNVLKDLEASLNQAVANRSLVSKVRPLVQAVEAEIDFRGLKTTDDLTKLVPAMVHGLYKGAEQQQLSVSDAAFTAESGLTAVVGIAMDDKYATFTPPARVSLPELLALENTRGVHHLQGNTKRVGAVQAGAKSLAKNLGRLFTVPTEILDALEKISFTSIASVGPVVSNSPVSSAILIAFVEGLEEGIAGLREANSSLTADDLLTRAITGTTKGLGNLKNEDNLTTTQASELKANVTDLFQQMSSSVGATLTAAEIEAQADTGFSSAPVRPNMVIDYPDDQKLVLKFKSWNLLDKEEFWEGEVGTGTKVGEVRYTYGSNGLLSKKEFYYYTSSNEEVLYSVNEGFQYDASGRMIRDCFGNTMEYDTLGRVIRRDTANMGGDWETYEYLPDGKFRRHYYFGNGVKAGYAEYRLQFWEGESILPFLPFWYGDHSKIGIIDWIDSDRYDMSGPVQFLGRVGQVKTIEHIWVDADTPNRFYEYMEFNRIGKLTRAYWLSDVNDPTSVSSEMFFDPFQRLLKKTHRDQTTGVLIVNTEYTYEHSNNSFLITLLHAPWSFKRVLNYKPFSGVYRIATELVYENQLENINYEKNTDYDANGSVTGFQSIWYHYDLMNNLISYNIDEYVIESNQNIGYDTYLNVPIDPVRQIGEFYNTSSLAVDQINRWVFDTNQRPQALVRYLRNSSNVLIPVFFRSFLSEDNTRSGIFFPKWWEELAYDPLSKIKYRLTRQEAASAMTMTLTSEGGQNPSEIELEVKIVNMGTDDLRNGKPIRATIHPNSWSNYIADADVTNGSVTFSFSVPSSLISFALRLRPGDVTSLIGETVYDPYFQYLDYLDITLPAETSAGDKVTITFDASQWRVTE